MLNRLRYVLLQAWTLIGSTSSAKLGSNAKRATSLRTWACSLQSRHQDCQPCYSWGKLDWRVFYVFSIRFSLVYFTFQDQILKMEMKVFILFSDHLEPYPSFFSDCDTHFGPIRNWSRRYAEWYQQSDDLHQRHGSQQRRRRKRWQSCRQ